LAVLPVKSIGAAKQRLGSVLGGGSRQALAQAMFSDVLASLRHVEGIDELAVVTGDAVAETTALGRRTLVLPDREQAGQSAAAQIGLRHAQVEGFDRVLLLPGDTPLLDPGELDDLLMSAAEQRVGVVIVPDRHGAGTNALLLAPPDAITPTFGPGSLERHLAAARSAELRHAVERPPSLLLDIDTPEDLDELARRLAGRRGLAPATRGALAQLDRSRVRGPSAAGRPRPAPAQTPA
jgi:2-phospho-L-lactate guanylyltransferase